MDKKIKTIDVMDDPNCTLKEWRQRIDILIGKYGESTIMFSDAGYNNVTLVVVPNE